MIANWYCPINMNLVYLQTIARKEKDPQNATSAGLSLESDNWVANPSIF